MNNLSLDAFRAARQFIETQARPLEAVRFRHAFLGGPVGAVVAELRVFQNPDGGFGRGLEPDLRAPESSALATSLAFQVLRGLPPGAGHELATPALAYLLVTLDREESHWRIIPPAAQYSPHAPWWDQAQVGEHFDPFSLNPTAELLGYLYEHAASVPEDVLELVKGQVVARLAAPSALLMHELLCCLRLSQSPGLPTDLAQVLQETLAVEIPRLLVREAAGWVSYCLRPLQVVESPRSSWLPGLEAAVETNLDYEIATQGADGAWMPNWDWSGLFPQAWDSARREWAGILTLEKLLTLQRFNRIQVES